MDNRNVYTKQMTGEGCSAAISTTQHEVTGIRTDAQNPGTWKAYTNGRSKWFMITGHKVKRAQRKVVEQRSARRG